MVNTKREPKSGVFSNMNNIISEFIVESKEQVRFAVIVY